jgi:hydroxyacylglutathione hydrolase
MRGLDPLDDAALRRAAREGAQVLDTRPTAEFLHGHLPGSLGIPMGRSFLHWAGTLLVPGRDVVLVVSPPVGYAGREAMRELALIGFDRVLGAIGPQALDDVAPGDLAVIPVVSATELVGGSEGRTLVDVRDDAEWDAGHIPGALHVPLTRLTLRVDELRGLGPIVVHCQAGLRSAIAASVLRAAGVVQVASLEGGYPAWIEAASRGAGRRP